MRSTASVTLGWASAFLAIVAMLLNSPALFFMATALIATILSSKVQAYLSVRGLKIQRNAPSEASQGEEVTIEFLVASQRKIKRPLVRLQDSIPNRLLRGLEKPAVPIAPAFGKPIRSSYVLVPPQRGVYHWKEVKVIGTDALGLANSEITYSLPDTELVVLPKPLPFDAKISFGAGAGSEDGTRTQRASSGTSVRSVREYVSGDPIRHIHWKSTAKRGTIMVKEFEMESDLRAGIIIQGFSPGIEPQLYEDLIGHALYLSDRLLWAGAQVWMVGLEEPEFQATNTSDRVLDVRRKLARLSPDHRVDWQREIQRGRSLAGIDRFFAFRFSDEQALDSILAQVNVESVWLVDESKQLSIPLGAVNTIAWRKPE